MSFLNFIKSLFSSPKEEKHVDLPVTKEVLPPLDNLGSVEEVKAEVSVAPEEVKVEAPVAEVKAVVEETTTAPTVKEIKSKSKKTEVSAPAPEAKPKSKPKQKPKK